MEDFSPKEVIKRILSKNRWSTEKELAENLGLKSQNTLTAYKKGKGSFSLDEITKICDVLNVDSRWLLFGETEKSKVQSDVAPQMVNIPVYEVTASAGHGDWVPAHEEQTSALPIPLTLLHELGASVRHCRIIEARGDSMLPTIPSGSSLIVDLSQKDLISGQICVLNVNGNLLVKRIDFHINGTLCLLSDNSLYPTQFINKEEADQIRIIGRVVYFGRIA